jgi:hypothetical protein
MAKHTGCKKSKCPISVVSYLAMDDLPTSP